MFGAGYFGKSYFGAGYFGPANATAPVSPTVTPDQTGGYSDTYLARMPPRRRVLENDEAALLHILH